MSGRLAPERGGSLRRRVVAAVGLGAVAVSASLALGLPAHASDPAVTGTVTSTASGSTVPLSGVTVFLYRWDATTGTWQWLDPATTGADGRYSISAPSGTYRVCFFPTSGTETMAQCTGGGTTVDSAQSFGLSGSGIVQNAQLGAGGDVSGRVTSGGAPRSDVYVDLERQTGSGFVYEGFGYTDSNGTYDIGQLEPGTYRATFTDYAVNASGDPQFAPSYYGSNAQDSARLFTVTGGGTTSGVDGVLGGDPASTGSAVTAPGPVPSPASPLFTDSSSSPFSGDITWLAQQGISTGWPMPDGTAQFRPGEAIARDAMAAFLYRAAGSPTVTVSRATFADVPTTDPFSEPIEWMAQQGISTGWTGTDGRHYFRPSAPVTRDAMAAFLYRAAHQTSSETHTGFSDVPSTSPFAKEIAWMRSSGISTGWTDGTYRPSAPVTREAMAAFLHRAHR